MWFNFEWIIKIKGKALFHYMRDVTSGKSWKLPDTVLGTRYIPL